MGNAAISKAVLVLFVAPPAHSQPYSELVVGVGTEYAIALPCAETNPHHWMLVLPAVGYTNNETWPRV